jgi:glycerol-3-phosphate acyltransferase PlsX
MGSAFAQEVIGIESPRVALLSNGEEPGKGTPDLVSVHEQLAGSRGAGLNFVGNIEGTQVVEGVADVVVMDGFTGNVTLKLIEGVSSRAMRLVSEMASASARGRLGNRLMAPTMRRMREVIDPEGPGGAYMLGLRHLGVVAHGRFSARGFARAIEVAARGVEHDVIGRTRVALVQAGALRPPSGRSGPLAEGAPGSSEPAATVSSP